MSATIVKVKKRPVLAWTLAIIFAMVLGWQQHVNAKLRETMPGQNVKQVYERLPLAFEINRGQTDNQVHYLARAVGYNIFLLPEGSVITFRTVNYSRKGHLAAAAGEKRLVATAALRLLLRGAKKRPRLVASEELPGRSNYFIGGNPQEWLTNIPTYARVRALEVYPGIDLVYHGSMGRLEYDFVVKPGVDPGIITVEFTGQKGMHIADNGDVIIELEGGPVRMHRPHLYQEIDDTRREIQGRYVLRGENLLGFQVAEYDQTRPLIIDPVLSLAGIGGVLDVDLGSAITLDSNQNAYITGVTNSADFPVTKGGLDTSLDGATDAFVTKLNTAGTDLIYSTYLGGKGNNDEGTGIAVDSDGNVYVTGSTDSSNFPTVNALDGTLGGGSDAFVSKLNTAGSDLLFSTYLGGSDDEAGHSIAVDRNRQIYVTGVTESSNFPTVNALDGTLGGQRRLCEQVYHGWHSHSVFYLPWRQRRRGGQQHCHERHQQAICDRSDRI
ncbi:MAG: SBBP repeat-containing protein [Deltaproteobacteria bacterium]|nr:SBBP repeat-containing protein [Deltaproteobacteria bacterium]